MSESTSTQGGTVTFGVAPGVFLKVTLVCNSSLKKRHSEKTVQVHQKDGRIL